MPQDDTRQPADWASVAGKVFVVTGAASGIGFACAELLSEMGAIVLGADLSPAPPLPGAPDAPGANQPQWATILDVSDRDAMFALARRAMDTYGRLDGWINSAGVMVYGPVVDITETELDRLLSINLKGTLWGCQAAMSVMQPQGFGAIVNLSSAAVDKTTAGRGTYAMTKAAVVQLTKTLSVEAAPYSIRVNAIAPGMVLTNITTYHWTREDGSVDAEKRDQVLKGFAENIPLNRVAAATEIARTAHYLVSDASSFTTGQVLRPNGGVAQV